MYEHCSNYAGWHGENLNGDYGETIESFEECRQLCGDNKECVGMVFNEGYSNCILKKHTTSKFFDHDKLRKLTSCNKKLSEIYTSCEDNKEYVGTEN